MALHQTSLLNCGSSGCTWRTRKTTCHYLSRQDMLRKRWKRVGWHLSVQVRVVVALSLFPKSGSVWLSPSFAQINLALSTIEGWSLVVNRGTLLMCLAWCSWSPRTWWVSQIAQTKSSSLRLEQFQTLVVALEWGQNPHSCTKMLWNELVSRIKAK